MVECTLRFTTHQQSDSGSFKLLELPSDICTALEGSANEKFRVTIKGYGNEDAVLCTNEKTYTIRSVVLSNSVLVVTPPVEDTYIEGTRDVVIRDQLSEILELLPSIPRLHVLDGLLRGQEYDEGLEEDEQMSEDEKPVKRKRFSYEDAKATLQASNAELDRGLRSRRVLILKGELRPIAPSHLATILELLLNYLVSLSLPHDSASTDELTAALEDDHDVKREVTLQVMGWFGDVAERKWRMDTAAVVKEVGLGILRPYRDDPIEQEEFLNKWRTVVSDSFQTHVSLELLAGNHLSHISILRTPPQTLLTYFPASALPVDPAARFGDLFLTRSRWRADEIAPFLSDICVDAKERDKLLLKFARAVTEHGAVWYTAKAKFAG